MNNEIIEARENDPELIRARKQKEIKRCLGCVNIKNNRCTLFPGMRDYVACYRYQTKWGRKPQNVELDEYLQFQKALLEAMVVPS